MGQDFLYEWAGYAGVAVYLGAYVALQIGLIPGVGYRYAMLNMVAALLVLVSLIQAFNMASAIIQVSWVVISVVGITRTYLISRRLFFTPEEQALIDYGLPGTPRLIARRILDAGYWINEEAGFQLTKEGEPVQALYFIASGSVRVTIGQKCVAEVEQGFIGEMNVMANGPASANVTVCEPARLFCISSDNLRRLTRNDSETAIYIEKYLSASTKHKLMQANAQLNARL